MTESARPAKDSILWAAKAAAACSRGRSGISRQPTEPDHQHRTSRESGDRSPSWERSPNTLTTSSSVLKYRQPLIHREFRVRLYEYVGGTIRGMKGHLIEIGGVADHVHLLTAIPPTLALSDAIRDIKAGASKWVNELPETRSRFEWKKGYAAFTVSHSQIGAVRRYLRNQETHHKQQTFEEEYIELLTLHEIEYDERYLFG